MKFKKMLSLGAVFITLLTSTATTYARDPQGELESYGTLPNMLRVMGWAFDADDMNSKTRVHVYIDGEAGNSKVPSYEIRADKSHKRYNGHGFDQTINVPTNWCGRRTVRLYALNDVGSGTFKQIGTLTVDIPAPNNSSNNNSNNKPQRGYINTQSKNLNLRRTPNGTIIGKLAKNTPVTILQGNSNGWTKVRTDSGQEGYVSSQYVAIGDPPKPDNRLDAAMNYIASLEGRAMDYDHYAGAQCVDLIKYYYDYLGVANYARGNGKDYATNSLPPGWQRIRGAVPQRGDILVYTSGGGGYGHVAIAESTDISWHQNYNGKYVRKITGNYKNIHVGYWGVIRPAF